MHPLAARIREPRPLAQDGQIRPAAPVGAIKSLGPGRQIDSQDNQQASADSQAKPGPRLDPKPRPPQNSVSRAGALPTSSLPNLGGWAYM